MVARYPSHGIGRCVIVPLGRRRQERPTMGYLAGLSGQKSILEKSTEVKHQVNLQRRTMPEQKVTLTEPRRHTVSRNWAFKVGARIFDERAGRRRVLKVNICRRVIGRNT